MRADGGDAVRFRATQPEIHAAIDVVMPPEALAVGRGRIARTGEAAVRIGRAVDDMALVEMRVHIDQHRPDVPAAEVDGRTFGGSRSRGLDGRDVSALNKEIDEQRAIAIGGRGGRSAQKALWNARRAQPVIAGFGNAKGFEGRGHRPDH